MQLNTVVGFIQFCINEKRYFILSDSQGNVLKELDRAKALETFGDLSVVMVHTQ